MRPHDALQLAYVVQCSGTSWPLSIELGARWGEVKGLHLLTPLLQMPPVTQQALKAQVPTHLGT